MINAKIEPSIDKSNDENFLIDKTQNHNEKVSITLEIYNTKFDEHNTLHQLKHYLPTQTPLRDFIHHNSLHAFQSMKFYDAIFKASQIFGYQVTLELSDFRNLFKTGRIRPEILENIIKKNKGEKNYELWLSKLLNTEYDEHKEANIGQLRLKWTQILSVDLDNQVQPRLFRIVSSYLDQGISHWKFPTDNIGFLQSIIELEKNSFTSFFKSKRVKNLLSNGQCTITNLLNILVAKESYYENYIYDQQFGHRGWSGMAATIEQRPDTLMDFKAITLKDFIILELLLEIDVLDTELGKKWKPLGHIINIEPQDIFETIDNTELNEVFKLWQDAFEWSYYDEVLAGISHSKDKRKNDGGNSSATTSFQAMFCIDERECSIRRHIEYVDENCETLGTPGFFGVEFYFQPLNAKFYDKLCPAPVTPKYLIKEYDVDDHKRHSEILYTTKSHNLILGAIITLSLGFVSAFKMLINLFSPKMSPAISNAFTHQNKHAKLTVENKDEKDFENGLQIGFTIDEMADRVQGVMQSTGLITEFAPIVYIIAHGSSSANNPHHGAHDCGACSGRPGSVNAKVLAIMANHSKVRDVLKSRGIIIPVATQFIGGMHDTAADEMEYYDIDILSLTNVDRHLKYADKFEKALDLNAKERSRRFASISTNQSIEKIRAAIKTRSVSLFEPRPELGHGTNTLCIIGSRDLTKELFLDRRAFLNSYDYKTDPDGNLLTGVMRPIGPVCGGINLEYYFSRVDNHKLGAGTKLPHNVIGLIGVANSCDGDLRPGLPLQMIEVHDPVRLLIVVEHYPEIILKTIQSAPEMYEWYINEWVHLVALHPDTNEFLYFKDGVFTKYQPLSSGIDIITNIHALIENAAEMKTNQIVDATQENLPVYSLK